MECAVCGKRFQAGNRPDGIPHGVGFAGKGGRIVNVCAGCVARSAFDHGVTDKVRRLLEEDKDAVTGRS